MGISSPKLHFALAGSEKIANFRQFSRGTSNTMNRTKKTWTQEIDERFLQAVLEGNLEQVKNYADKGADLYQLDEEGVSPLFQLLTLQAGETLFDSPLSDQTWTL